MTTEAAILQLLRDRTNREVEPSATLDDYGFDSLETIELRLAIEERFGIHIREDAWNQETRISTIVGDVRLILLNRGAL